MLPPTQSLPDGARLMVVCAVEPGSGCLVLLTQSGLQMTLEPEQLRQLGAVLLEQQVRIVDQLPALDQAGVAHMWALARQTLAHTDLLASYGAVPGRRLRLREPVSRYPDFEVPACAEGTLECATNERIAIRMDDAIAGAEHWNNCIEWAPSNAGPEEMWSFFRGVVPADDQAYGAPPGVVESRGFAERLARAFCGFMHSTVEPAEIAEIVRRNRTSEYVGCCASHDFCDANMVMADAWTSVAWRPVVPERGEDAAAWNRAWKLARDAQFCAPAVEPHARYQIRVVPAAASPSSRVELTPADSLSGHELCDRFRLGQFDLAGVAELVPGGRWDCLEPRGITVTRLQGEPARLAPTRRPRPA